MVLELVEVEDTRGRWHLVSRADLHSNRPLLPIYGPDGRKLAHDLDTLRRGEPVQVRRMSLVGELVA